MSFLSAFELIITVALLAGNTPNRIQLINFCICETYWNIDNYVIAELGEDSIKEYISYLTCTESYNLEINGYTVAKIQSARELIQGTMIDILNRGDVGIVIVIYDSGQEVITPITTDQYFEFVE